MQQRSEGFLSEENISHDSEIFDYIRELHEYLWEFVRAVNPSANGSLEYFVDDALKSLLDRPISKMEITDDMITLGIKKWFNRICSEEELNSQQYRRDMRNVLEAVLSMPVSEDKPVCLHKDTSGFNFADKEKSKVYFGLRCNDCSKTWDIKRTEEADIAAMEAEREWLTQKPKQPTDTQDNDGWIAHDGSSYPVLEGVLVDVKYRNGEIRSKVRALDPDEPTPHATNWSHYQNNYDIIAYRIIDEPKKQTFKLNEMYKIWFYDADGGIYSVCFDTLEKAQKYQFPDNKIAITRADAIEFYEGEGLNG